MKRLVTLVVLSFLTVACTDPGPRTEMGAAAGGAVGAGLGALVGSQTGDAATGLVMGGLAGAAAGGAVGNALDDQDNVLRSQDEAIERQQKIIQAQATELEELRRISSDSVSFQKRPSHATPGARASLRRPAPISKAARASTGGSSLQEKTILRPTVRAAGRTPVEPKFADSNNGAMSNLATSSSERTEVAEIGSQIDNRVAEISGTSREMASVESLNNQVAKPVLRTERIEEQSVVQALPNRAECQEAAKEAGQAEAASEAADRLFHLRRALRLCPEHAEFHNRLGEIYLSLQRKIDAEFEFREALKLNPSHTKASANLSSLLKAEG